MNKINPINPIKPSDVEELKTKSFPDEVIDCFNKLIVKNFYKNESIVYQDDVVNEICKSMDIERSEVFSNGYLNIEDIFRQQGWKVEYDSPGYCESYRAKFIFRK